MITNYQKQKQNCQERLKLKSQEIQLSNIIRKGTSCSPFESEVIVGKAKEVFNLGEFSDAARIQPGQLMWMVVSAEEPAGKPISECKMVKVKLTLFEKSEDSEVTENFGLSGLRQAQISRMTIEAKDQNGLLTQEDLSQILGHHERTIRRDIAELSKKGICVPTRGNQKDIGPGITHREMAVKLFLQGMEPLDIAKRIHHSLKSIERYIDTFCRVVFIQEKLHNTLKSAMVTGISVQLVNKYLEIKEEFKKQECYKERIDSIISRGTAYWEMIDFKKKSGQSKRRNG